AEDGIRDFHVTGVQTCALPISAGCRTRGRTRALAARSPARRAARDGRERLSAPRGAAAAGRRARASAARARRRWHRARGCPPARAQHARDGRRGGAGRDAGCPGGRPRARGAVRDRAGRVGLRRRSALGSAIASGAGGSKRRHARGRSRRCAPRGPARRARREPALVSAAAERAPASAPFVLEGLHADGEGGALLRELHFAAPRGAIAALIGAAGSGKSTALRIALGLARASGGRALVLGRDLALAPRAERLAVLRRVGAVWPGGA